MKRLLGLDLNLLVALQVLLEEESVTGAARRLGVTQPAVSHKLKRLREALDDELFLSGPRGLVPTARAQAMAQPLRMALEQLASSVAPDDEFDPQTAAREFVLCGPDLLEFAVLPAVRAYLAAEAPGITLAVVPRRHDTFDRMKRGEIDFVFGPSFPPLGGLRQLKLYEEPLIVLGRSKHPAFRGGLTLEKYLAAEHVLIAPNGTPGGIVDDALARQGRSRRVAVRVAGFASAPFLVAQSDLLLTAPQSLHREAARYVALSKRPLPLPLPPTSSLVAWHERLDREPAHRWFRRVARRRFGHGRGR